MASNVKKTEIWIITAFIRIMKTVFVMQEGVCRFEPTCTVYAQQAIKNYSMLKAGRLIIWRLLRCNPFNNGGFDPIEEKRKGE